MRVLRPGDSVVEIATGACGVVVWTWPSDDDDERPDHHVAFFGKAFPLGKPLKTPKIVQRPASVLRAVVTDEYEDAIRWRLPLHAAVDEANAEAIRILLRDEDDQDVIDGALLRACATANLEAMRLLLRKGADANAVGEHGVTPLMIASLTGSLDAAKLLLKAGAAIDATDASGTSAHDWASHAGSSTSRATRAGAKAIVALLEKTGAKTTKAKPRSRR